MAKALGVGVEHLYGLKSEDRMVVEKKGSGKRREAQIHKIFGDLSPTDQRALLKQAKGLLKSKT